MNPSSQIVSDIVQRSYEIVNAHKHDLLTATELNVSILNIQHDLQIARNKPKSVVIHYALPDGYVRQFQPYQLSVLLNMLS